MNSFVISILCHVIMFWISVECMYSTKTHYYDSFTKEQLDFINTENNYQVDNCNVNQLYMIVRHGSRYPSHKQSKRSIEFLEILRRSSVNSSYVETFLNKIDENMFKDTPHYGLTQVGGFEQQEIGSRFRKRYFDLIKNVNLNDVSFVSSSKPRSFESGGNFSYHLFLDHFKDNKSTFSFEDFLSTLEINDDMMRGFDVCKIYLDKITNNKESSREYNLFKEQEIVKNVVENFKKRHFINENVEIDIDDLFIVATICDIEYTHRLTENWCRLLLDSDKPILGYFNDLKNYYKKAHGSHINSYATCLILKDYINELEKFISNHRDRKKVLLRFGHAENILPLISSFNLFKDEIPLKADNYNEQFERLFKSNIIAPFSSNIALVLLKCTGEDYKIKLLVNELPIGVINAGNGFECSNNVDLSDNKKINESICTYKSFKNKLMQKNEHCFKIDNFCEINEKEEL